MSGKTAPEMWDLLTFRQLSGLYEIFIDRKVEDYRRMGEMHGLKFKDGSRNCNTIDLRNIKDEKEWQQMRSKLYGELGSLMM